MPLTIDDEEAHRQARRLADLTGQPLAVAVREAIADKLRHIEGDAVTSLSPGQKRPLRSLAAFRAGMPSLRRPSADLIREARDEEL